MAQNPGDKHLSSILSNISIEIPEGELVAQEVLPLVPVKKKADEYFKYDVKGRLKMPDNGGLRPPGAYTQEVDWTVSRDDYSCKTYALGSFVEDSEQDNADAPLDPYTDAYEQLQRDVLRLWEGRAAKLAFTAANFPASQKTTLSGTSQWSHDDADPIKAILQGRMQCHGKKPNRFLTNEETEFYLLNHPKVLSRLTGGAYPGNPANVDRKDFKKLIKVDTWVVAEAEFDATDKKAVTTRTPIWGKHALLYYYEKKPGIKKVSFGYTFSWQKMGGKKGFNVRVVRNDERGDGGRKIICEQCVDEKQVCTDVSYFWENAVA